MGVAFAVLAVRTRAGTVWLLAGGLTVFSGVQALWHVPPAPAEIAAGKFAAGSYAVRIDAGWYGVERDGRTAWAWSAGQARLLVETAPRHAAPVRVRLKLRAIAPRTVVISDGSAVLWQGPVGEAVERIEFTAPRGVDGRLALELRTAAAPVAENDHPDARALGFALYGIAVD
jgi:hypothetical protein